MSVHEIYYNYPNISLNASDIPNDSNTFDYISMPIITEDTFVYTVDNNSTIEPATKIYLREIDTVTIPGFTNMGDQVLIIEHTSTSEKYYTAFKLTVDSANGTDQIDTLFKLTSTMELDLNEIIERPVVSGTCNVYKDTPVTKSLFAFDGVDIKIKTKLTDLKKVTKKDAFYIDPVDTNTTVEEIPVVNAPDKIEVECTPVDVDDEANDLLYGFSKSDIADYSTLQSTTLFYFFAFTMTILSFVIPPLYKYCVIDFINYASYAKTLKQPEPVVLNGVNNMFDDGGDSKKKGVYLHEWNQWLIFFNLLVMFAIFMTAISDKTGLTVGVFYIIVFIFSFSLIYMKTNDKGFMTTNLPKPAEGETAAAPEIDYDASYDWTDRNDKTHSWKDTLMYIIFGNRKWINGLFWALPLILGSLLGLLPGVELQPSVVVLLTFSCFTIIRLIFHSFVINNLRTEIAK